MPETTRTFGGVSGTAAAAGAGPATATREAAPDDFVEQPDGSLKSRDGTVFSAKALDTLLTWMAAKHLVLRLLPAADGAAQLNAGIHGLLQGAKDKDPTRLADHLGQVVRGACAIHGVGSGRMDPAKKVPRLSGLVAAGHSAVRVLQGFAAESFVAQQRTDPDELSRHTIALQIHEEVHGVLAKSAERVYHTFTALAERVAAGSGVVYEAIEKALPLNEDLQRAALPLSAYIEEPKEKAQHTRHVVQKTKEEVTQKVTKDIQEKTRLGGSLGSLSGEGKK